MKVFRVLGRNIRDSFKSVFRNFSLSLASISCITITLLVVAIAIILSYNVNNFATLIEKDVTIVTFVDNEATVEQSKMLENQIKSLDNIDSVKFESRMDIMKDMMISSDVFSNIMSTWTQETTPIQDTYLVKVVDINRIKETADKIKEMEFVTVVKYGEGMVEQLVAIFDVIRKISVGLVIALIIVTAFLIGNTIKITIFSRKREIEIMRLVGASNLNIKIPFILEGLFLGVMGAIIPVCATVFGYTTLYTKVDGQLFTPLIRLITPEPFVYFTSIVLILIGMAVGMFGSVRAVRKYLKI